MSDVSREGTIAAAGITSNPIKRFKEIVQAKIFNMIGSNPEIAKKYVQAAKAGRGNPEAVNDRVADAVNDAAGRLNLGITSAQITSAVPRQVLAQAVGPQPEDRRPPTRTNTGLGSINVQPASNVSAVGSIDITQPGVGATLGLSPADQAIATRGRSPLSVPKEQYGGLFNR